MKTQIEDPIMPLFKAWVESCGLTLAAIGERMGYDGVNARQRVFQILKTGDPSMSVVRRFATAAGLSLGDLVEGRVTPPKQPKKETIAQAAPKKRGRPKKAKT
jgi:hypothetical protein